MTIPNFKSPEDWETFYLLFDKNWQCKKVLLDRVKNQLFTDEVEWDKLEKHQLEFTNKLVDDILSHVNEDFVLLYGDYSEKDDQINDKESLENIEETNNHD